MDACTAMRRGCRDVGACTAARIWRLVVGASRPLLHHHPTHWTSVQALVGRCSQLTEVLTSALHHTARRELEGLLAYMAPSSYSVTKMPATLDMLSRALEAHKCAECSPLCS